MKQRIKFLSIISLILLLCGCSTKPVFYSRWEVRAYAKSIFKNITYTGRKLHQSDEENIDYYYFKDKKGRSFSVYTYTYHPYFDATELTGFYEKGIGDSYLFDIYTQEKENIKSVLDKYSKEGNWSYETSDDVASILIDMNSEFDETKLSSIAKAVCEIDQILDYQYDYSNATISTYEKNANICVAIKPTDEFIATQKDDYDYVHNYYCQQQGVAFSSDSSKRYSEEEVINKLTDAYSNTMKTWYGQERYPFDETLWLRTKCPNLTFNAENADYSLIFTYYRSVDDYIVSSLDPCQDFDDFPYSYTNSGAFKELVETLGGTYSCDNWNAVWDINGHHYEATLKTRKKDSHKYYFDDFIVYKDGKVLELSKHMDGIYNSTVSGREFTLSDIEKLLSIEFETDQFNMTATIK